MHIHIAHKHEEQIEAYWASDPANTSLQSLLDTLHPSGRPIVGLNRSDAAPLLSPVTEYITLQSRGYLTHWSSIIVQTKQ